MLQAVKVWLFRKYYRVVNAHNWRGHTSGDGWAAMEIPGDAGGLHARLYNQHGGSDRPLIIYFHGGGWVIGDLQTHSPFCEALGQHTGCSVIAVDYRLAPEHPYPAAPQDCRRATQWISKHVGDFGLSNHQLIVAGDSAGAQLATVTCLAADDELRQQLAAQLLLYPAVVHYSADFPSYHEKVNAKPLTTNIMMWFWDTYLNGLAPEDDRVNAAQPLKADNLAILPATFLLTAEQDPLRDEGRAYAQALQGAGVTTHYTHFEQSAHGFACSEGPTEDFVALMADIKRWIEDLHDNGKNAGDTAK